MKEWMKLQPNGADFQPSSIPSNLSFFIFPFPFIFLLFLSFFLWSFLFLFILKTKKKKVFCELFFFLCLSSSLNTILLFCGCEGADFLDHHLHHTTTIIRRHTKKTKEKQKWYDDDDDRKRMTDPSPLKMRKRKIQKEEMKDKKESSTLSSPFLPLNCDQVVRYLRSRLPREMSSSDQPLCNPWKRWNTEMRTNANLVQLGKRIHAIGSRSEPNIRQTRLERVK